MIQRGLPFYIILNDRGSATTDEQEHQRELESIQQKIITNLIQVSGDDHIDEKYEVITLNTKRAWTGIQRSLWKKAAYGPFSFVWRTCSGKTALSSGSLLRSPP